MLFSINRNIIVLVCLMVAASRGFASEPGGAQWNSPEHLGQPKFDIQFIERLIEDTSMCRVDVFIQIANDFLQFVRRDSNSFEATADINLSIEQKGKGEVQRQSSIITQITGDYENTNSRDQYLTTAFSIEQPPGNYILKVILTDRESFRREIIEKTILLKSKSLKHLTISDLMLLGKSGFSPGTRIPYDNLTGGLLRTHLDTVYLFFDLNRPTLNAPCHLDLTVFDADEKKILVDSLSLIGGTNLSVATIPVSVSGLSFGRYRAVLTCRQDGETSVGQKRFDVNTGGLPDFIHDLDLSIKQLKYIASESEIEALESEFASEREKAFIAFWNDLYPVEGENTNGKMVEYFSRIDFANRNFTGTMPGWESDRGRILVIYGHPSDIERGTSERDGIAFETWYYNRLGKRFTFRDDYGFGDFRLATPAW